MIGQTFSHYRILEKLGGGGMGVVYKAEDIKLKRFAALKFLPPELTDDAEAKARFVQEAQAASALDHNNICTIFEIGETEEGRLFIAMAYYPKATLKERLRRDELTVEEAVDVAIQVGKGLQRAHESGIVHRDIKPANIMFTEHGEVKLVDFGLAKLTGAERITSAGIPIGTLAYMSPEQTSGLEVDHRTDIWSLGVVLYEMLTRQVPFVGDSPPAVIVAIVTEKHRPARDSRRDVPPEIDQIIDGALTKEPGRRYRDVAKMLADLRAVRDNLFSESMRMVTMPLNARAVRVPPEGPSIAVLPFSDLSAEKNQGFFCDGMTEEITNKLGRIGSLRVASKTSAYSFKDKLSRVPEIGRMLGVSTVLEGGVRRFAGRLRITVQLVDVERGYHLWSGSYDKKDGDHFDIQEEVALEVAVAVKRELGVGESSLSRMRYRENVEAYSKYLQGRHYWSRMSEGGLQRGIVLFGEALQRDADYAPAEAGLADSYSLLGVWGFSRPADNFELARDAIARAKKNDGEFPEALVSQALIHTFFDWDRPAAGAAFKRAIEQDPDNPLAHFWLSFHLLTGGEFEEALRVIEKASILDPLSTLINMHFALCSCLAGEEENGMRLAGMAFERDPGNAAGGWYLGMAYLQTGRSEEALAPAQRAAMAPGGSIYLQANLAGLYASLGDIYQANELLAAVEAAAGERFAPAYAAARAHAVLGNSERAFALLQKSVAERDPMLTTLAFDPCWKGLRGDRRFKEALRSFGIEE